MQRIRVYQKDCKDTYLKLEEWCSGLIKLVVVDENGDHKKGGEILMIDEIGRLVLTPNLDDDLGFCLDRTGRIKIATGYTINREFPTDNDILKKLIKEWKEAKKKGGVITSGPLKGYNKNKLCDDLIELISEME